MAGPSYKSIRIDFSQAVAEQIDRHTERLNTSRSKFLVRSIGFLSTRHTLMETDRLVIVDGAGERQNPLGILHLEQTRRAALEPEAPHVPQPLTESVFMDMGNTLYSQLCLEALYLDTDIAGLFKQGVALATHVLELQDSGLYYARVDPNEDVPLRF